MFLATVDIFYARRAKAHNWSLPSKFSISTSKTVWPHFKHVFASFELSGQC